MPDPAMGACFCNIAMDWLVVQQRKIRKRENAGQNAKKSTRGEEGGKVITPPVGAEILTQLAHKHAL